MVIERLLIDVVACPQCNVRLISLDGDKSLQCERCKLKFPVRDGIPFLVVEEALGRTSDARGANDVKLPRVQFRVTEGPDRQMTFQLEEGACRAIGRGSIDPNKTQVFTVDVALALDDNTKNLVLKYIGKQFRRKDSGSGGSGFGGFRRAPDIVLTDSSLSRLHAMFFHDRDGVGILDLVSKNGTFVGGREVESAILAKGAVVEIGETKIVFEG